VKKIIIQHKRKKEDKYLKCPECQIKIAKDSISNRQQILKCPSCNGIYYLKEIKGKSSEKENQKSVYRFFFKIPPNILAFLAGFILIFIGLILLYVALFENLRLGITLILIGTFCFFFISEKKRSKNKLLISEKITIISATWFFISLLITTNLDITSFFLLFFIGFLVLKELVQSYVSDILDMKMKIIVLGFFAVYSMLIINTILPYFMG
jgi:hypothetical protein